MSTFTRSGLFTPFTPVFNASGQPGISLPLFEGEDGLPLAVQLVGRPAGEGALLALASQLEEAPGRGPRAAAACAGRAGLVDRRATRLHRLGYDPEAFGVAGARSCDHRALHQLGLVPGRERARTERRLQQAQRARDDRRGHLQQRPGPIERVAARAGRSRCASACRGPRAHTAAVRLRGRASSAITHAAASSAQIG